ncbi:MAG: cytochrome c biogenesis protein [Armatimonadetes bacterium]|nr:cytochrome c biogenesis protein [Armatimonadota bacterium]MDW8028624.1 cytochrome c biogenesis protein CcsA [Armatimonadota bacterium]
MEVLWTLLGWLAVLCYLVSAGLVLWSLWQPKKRLPAQTQHFFVAAIFCHLLYFAEGAFTKWLKLDTPEAVAIVLGFLVSASSFIQWRRHGTDVHLGFLLPFSAVLLAFGIIEKPTQLSPELRRDILLLHVTLMMLGYLMLTLSFGSSIVHLVTLWALKRKRNLALLDKLPPLETTEKLTGKLVLIGLPIMTLGMIVGILWARIEGRSAWSDPKVFLSFITSSIFAAYLYARFVRRWEAVALDWLISIGFAFLLVTFLFVRHTLALE